MLLEALAILMLTGALFALVHGPFAVHLGSWLLAHGLGQLEASRVRTRKVRSLRKQYDRAHLLTGHATGVGSPTPSFSGGAE